MYKYILVKNIQTLQIKPSLTNTALSGTKLCYEIHAFTPNSSVYQSSPS